MCPVAARGRQSNSETSFEGCGEPLQQLATALFVPLRKISTTFEVGTLLRIGERRTGASRISVAPRNQRESSAYDPRFYDR